MSWNLNQSSNSFWAGGWKRKRYEPWGTSVMVSTDEDYGSHYYLEYIWYKGKKIGEKVSRNGPRTEGEVTFLENGRW